MVQNQVSVSDEEIIVEVLKDVLKTETHRRYRITLRHYVRGEFANCIDLVLWDTAVDDLIESLIRQRALKIEK